MLSAGFEPAVPAVDRPHTYALDRAATDIFYYTYYLARAYKITVIRKWERRLYVGVMEARGHVSCHLSNLE